MYEPLLDVHVSDRHASNLQTFSRGGRDARRVVVVAEIFGDAGEATFAPAQRSTAGIVESLLACGEVGLLATGDEAGEWFANAWDVEARRQAAARASAQLAAGTISALDYVRRAFLQPGLPCFGVADWRVDAAAEARAGRFGGLAQLRLPLLGRLRRHLDRVLARRCPEIAALHQLSLSPSRLPEIFDLTDALAIDLTPYPFLLGMKEAHRHEQLDPGELSEQWRWLQETVVLRYLQGHGGGPAGGLMPLLERAVREDDRHVLEAQRPLHACTGRELDHLLRASLRDLEANRRQRPSVLARLLDLVALLGLDDARCRRLRPYYRSLQWAGSLRLFQAEADDLREQLVERLADRRPAVAELHALSRSLAFLTALVEEKLPLSEAEEALARPPSAVEIGRRLNAAGEPLSAEEEAAAALLDRACVPPALSFYEHCSALVDVIADNLIARMGERRTKAAVLLCGGFYTQGVAARLQQREVLCSLIYPQLEEGPDQTAVREPDLHELRRRIGSFERERNIRMVFLGGGPREHLRRRRVDAEAEAGRAGEAPPWDRPADAATWTRLQWLRTRHEEELAQWGEEALHECRVCKRRRPLEERPAFCFPGCEPDLVLPCPDCDPAGGRFLCGRCAGSEPAPRLPGHGAGDAAAGGAMRLVCNLHGVALGEPDRPPRIFAAPLAGHTAA